MRVLCSNMRIECWEQEGWETGVDDEGEEAR
jgi:hypothetical protein